MSSRKNIDALKESTNSLLDETLVRIRSERQDSPPNKEKYFRTTEYYLCQSKEYVDGVWEMLASGKCEAALALSRWVLEAAMNLWWVVVDEDKTRERLRDLCGEALRNDANLWAACAELWPDQASVYRAKESEAQEMKNDLDARRLPNLRQRIKDIKSPDKPDWPNLYALYRICCTSSHPDLRVWQRFKKVGEVTVSTKPPENAKMASWMLSASTLYLVAHTCRLTEIEGSPDLTAWWKSKIRPLLS